LLVVALLTLPDSTTNPGIDLFACLIRNRFRLAGLGNHATGFYRERLYLRAALSSGSIEAGQLHATLPSG